MIKRFNEHSNSDENKKVSEERNLGVFGIDKLPSNVHSRMTQNFFDYHTRGRVTGKSKYELNRDLFELAQKKGDIGTLAQFCLQITRESIQSDENMEKRLKAMEDIIKGFNQTDD